MGQKLAASHKTNWGKICSLLPHFKVASSFLLLPLLVPSSLALPFTLFSPLPAKGVGVYLLLEKLALRRSKVGVLF